MPNIPNLFVHSVKNSPLYLKGKTQGWPSPEYTLHSEARLRGRMEEAARSVTRVTRGEDVSRPLPPPDKSIMAVVAAVCQVTALSCV